jgi:F-type H+-transporting ATPase subunit gamma
LQEAVDLFNANKVGEVFVVYTEFNSTVKQTVKIEKILPLEANAESTVKLQKTTEPSGPEMVDFVANRYLEAALTQYILESLASEHASRMLAMKNATDNAGDLIDDLTLASNNATASSHYPGTCRNKRWSSSRKLKEEYVIYRSTHAPHFTKNHY